MFRYLPLALLLALSSPLASAEKQLLWGDTHLHSAYSFDAFINQNQTATPDIAYRFARGEPVVHPGHRARMQLQTPLDFLVVSDHAEYLGVAREIYFNGVQMEDAGLVDGVKGWFARRYFKKMIDGENSFEGFVSLLPNKGDPVAAAADNRSLQETNIPNAEALVEKTWLEQTRLADQYNAPGTFTALIGWEWSSLAGGANLHRVVFTSADAATASKFIPYSSADSLYPDDLWRWLESTSEETGAEFVSIPHNSNISKGFMFPEEKTLRDQPIDEAYARLRAKWETVTEVTQIKGDSETHSALSPTDEFADFETYSYYIQQEAEEYTASPGDYIRSALKSGLALGKRIGVNPYKFGVIGSTDSHSGLATAEENNFGGKMAVDGSPETKQRFGDEDNLAAMRSSGWSMSASGLAAVWAEENTRAAIMAAFKRKEVYATTGPRIQLRVFGGWDFTEADLQATDVTVRGYAKGVSMGGDLGARAGNADGPGFLMWATKDPVEANLDRIQVVKGWLDAKGVPQEQVFNVAWAGERALDNKGILPAVGNTVNSETGRYSNTIGSAELKAFWVDRDFDPAQSAFYYVRVLQIPTPRHVLLDALAIGEAKPKDGDSIIQERAYSSPIWFNRE